MEAWKEELYHYGVKGMKWGKRKQKAAEQLGREYEQAARQDYDASNQSYNNFLKSPFSKSTARSTAYSNKVNERYTKQLNKVDTYHKAYKKNKHVRYTPQMSFSKWPHTYSHTDSDNRSNTFWTQGYKLTGKSAEKAKKRTRRRVAAIDTKNKVKSFAKNLFNGKKK